MSGPESRGAAGDPSSHERLTQLQRECEVLEAEVDVYRDLYQHAPDMYGLLDVATATILECNEAMLRIFGRERDEIVGKHFFEFHPADWHERLQMLVEHFRVTGESPDAEIEFLRGDGTRVPATARVTPIRDGQGHIVRARSVMRDITVQKANELALAQAQERFRRITETIGMVPWESSFDPAMDTGDGGSAARRPDPMRQLTLTYVGPQCERLLGYTAEECLQPGFWGRVVHAEDRERVLSHVSSMLAGGHEESIEYRIIAGDGRTVWLLNQSNLVHHPHGAISVTGVSIDLSDRKLASERRRRVMHELDHRVKNTLAIVLAIADRTRRTAGSFDEFKALLSSRVRGLARIHAGLSTADRMQMSMERLVRAACGTRPRLDAAGPSVSLPLRVAQPLGLALRELVTNAASHGALSTDTGSASLRWSLEEADERSSVSLEWTERDGPRVEPPGRLGCGMYLIKDALEYDTDAEVKVGFAGSGVTCAITIPL